MEIIFSAVFLLIAVMGIVSTGVNTVLSGKVKTICMVDALKGVE